MSAPSATLKLKRPWALATLPPLPAIALRVMELVSKENVDLREIAETIQSDPAFAAELLRVANSAMFSTVDPVLSVHHATVSLGLDYVKALSITVALRAYMKNALKTPALRRCWRHSVACALLTEELAVACRVKADTAYTAGLLHDVGRMGLLSAYPNEYSNALGVSAEFAFDVLKCEQDLFDIDHCEAGAWLANEWMLPEALVETVAHHHEDPPRGTSCLSLVSLGCRFADAFDYTVLPTHQSWTFEEIRARLPDSVRARYDPDLEALRERVAKRLESLM
ncbi:MAG: HDOD domain-containing protein [Acidobacteria bacterium]|nr:HDOD domain-containing protein [Acidobacteriota bacterium]